MSLAVQVIQYVTFYRLKLWLFKKYCLLLILLYLDTIMNKKFQEKLSKKQTFVFFLSRMWSQDKVFHLTGTAALPSPWEANGGGSAHAKVANNVSHREKVTSDIMQRSKFSGIWKAFCKLQLVLSAVPSRRKLITPGWFFYYTSNICEESGNLKKTKKKNQVWTPFYHPPGKSCFFLIRVLDVRWWWWWRWCVCVGWGGQPPDECFETVHTKISAPASLIT